VAFEIDDDNYVQIGIPWAEKTRAFTETETLLAPTPYGELYLHQLSPLNQATLKEMASRAKALGAGYTEFARLPDRKKEEGRANGRFGARGSGDSWPTLSKKGSFILENLD
jgi:hypothetical protein